LNSFHHSQKSPLLSSFQQFYATPFVACVEGKMLYSSSTWWAIVTQYKDFEKSQVSRPLLTTAPQTATFSY